MLALLLRDYAWEVMPDQDLGYVMVPFPRPKEGLRVRFMSGYGGNSYPD